MESAQGATTYCLVVSDEFGVTGAIGPLAASQAESRAAELLAGADDGTQVSRIRLYP